MSPKWLFQAQRMADSLALSLFEFLQLHAGSAGLTYPYRFVVDPALSDIFFYKFCPQLWGQMPLLFRVSLCTVSGRAWTVRLPIGPLHPLYQ